MKGIRSLVYLVCLFCLPAAFGQYYAQFADTWNIPSPALIQGGTVHFDTGTPQNPAGTSFFNMIITNTGGWTPTDISHPIPGNPIGNTIPPVFVHPSYSALYSVANLDVLSFRATAGSTVSFTFDFSNLPGGVLPAGSVLAWVDIDENEQVIITSTTPGWTSGAQVFGDITAGSPIEPTQPNPGPADFPAVSLLSDVVTITGKPTVTDSVGTFVPLLQPVSSITVLTQGSGGNPYSQYFTIATTFIPEPTTGALVLMGAGVIAARRRRL